MILSDHGFGPQWGVLNLVKLLEKHGLIVWRKPRLKELVLRAVLGIGRRLRLGKLLPSKVRNELRSVRANMRSLVSQLDLDVSKVIIPEYTIPFGAIHVNPRFKHLRDKILMEVADVIQNVSEEVGEENLHASIWLPKELYSGDRVELLPDLIFTVNDWSCVVTKTKDNYLYLDEPYSPRHTGSHRLHGIFIVWGKDVKNGVNMPEISILDIAPTILHMYSAPLPSNINGRVLKDVFHPDSKFVKRKTRFVELSYYNKLRLAKKVRKIREQF